MRLRAASEDKDGNVLLGSASSEDGRRFKRYGFRGKKCVLSHTFKRNNCRFSYDSRGMLTRVTTDDSVSEFISHDEGGKLLERYDRNNHF